MKDLCENMKLLHIKEWFLANRDDLFPFTGKKTRRVKCMRKDDKSAVADSVCEKGGLEKPEDEMPCNTEECPTE